MDRHYSSAIDRDRVARDGIEHAEDGRAPINMCDGCQRGLPLVGRLHRDASRHPWHDGHLTGCTADRYRQPSHTTGLPDRQIVREDGIPMGGPVEGFACGAVEIDAAGHIDTMRAAGGGVTTNHDEDGTQRFVAEGS